MIRHNYTSVGEEIFNAVSHGVGACLGVVGWIVLLWVSLNHQDPGKIIGFTIFSVTLILMYLASTLFHSLTFTRAKKVFRVLDHSSVFLFIAGTYTPFLLMIFPKGSSPLFLGIIWLCAILGIIFKIFFVDKLIVSLIFYLTLGWAGVLMFHQPSLGLSLSQFSREFLVIGGISYTVGVIFYLYKKLVFNHGIWHLFVLGGSACHFISILLTEVSRR